MTNDCADGLREHGKYKITNFGKFQVSQRTGKIEFTPYTAFLDRMENEETNDNDEDDNNWGEIQRNSEIRGNCVAVWRYLPVCTKVNEKKKETNEVTCIWFVSSSQIRPLFG